MRTEGSHGGVTTPTAGAKVELKQSSRLCSSTFTEVQPAKVKTSKLKHILICSMCFSFS